MSLRITVIINSVVLLIVFSFGESKRVKRVIGGAEVPCGDEIGVGSLRSTSDDSHLCGAYVLAPDVAITAAHCVRNNPNFYTVSLRNYCKSNNGETPNTQVSEVISHPEYDPVTRAHDIAVLRLRPFDDITWPSNTAALPISSFGLSGDCTIYGYGYTNITTRELSKSLLAADVKIISLDKCTELLGEFVAPKYNGGMLCALGDGVDACEGDSGGPLICAGKLQGIASYGVSCGVPGLPGVYTGVGPNLRWLRGVLKDLRQESND